jgi:hypothetical protein
MRVLMTGVVLAAMLGTAAADVHTSVKIVPPQHTKMVPHQTLYLNNCAAGCDIKIGSSDANTNTTDIGSSPTTFTEFAWMPGEWDAIVKCVQEAYSPYDITVTDQRPLGGFNENIVAGDPVAIGFEQGVGGVADVSSDCSPLSDAVSFTFAAAAADVFAQEDSNNRVWGVCWIIAQESAHAYGLPDHEIKFTDTNESACSDPMTYQDNCGGQKFFRNRPALCGGFMQQACFCAPTVNSHLRLRSILGVGQSTIEPPTSSIVMPTGGSVSSGFGVQASAGSRRGIGHVDLYLNGHLWATTPGAKFGAQGQPNPSSYAMIAPATVPDGVIDITVKAFDDIEEGVTESDVVTVTKGAPCADATSCLNGQKCEAGKCFWDPPVGVLGDPCTYNEFCTTGMCQESSEGSFCTKDCVNGSTDSCPAMFDCIATTDAQGVCLPQVKDSAGCCSVGHESQRAVWARLGVGLFVFGLLLRRRRRH